MGVLQRFERRIESLVNRPFAKAFKAEVQPVEVASALQRECDARAAIVARGRTMVPNAFLVELGQHDYDRLVPYRQALGAELADMVREHAQEQRYSFLGPVSVDLALVDDLDTGMFRIRSDARAAKAAPPGARAGGRPAGSGTSAAEPVGPPVPTAYVELAGTPVALGAGRTVIGRGSDADLRLDDPGVSRRHAEIRLDPSGAARVVDLGSTNGIAVDGQRVGEADLADGARLVLGSTTLVFRTGGAG